MLLALAGGCNDSTAPPGTIPSLAYVDSARVSFVAAGEADLDVFGRRPGCNSVPPADVATDLARRAIDVHVESLDPGGTCYQALTSYAQQVYVSGLTAGHYDVRVRGSLAGGVPDTLHAITVGLDVP